MIKKIIQNTGSFPLSKAVLHDSKYTLEISGQIGIDEKTGELVNGIENQTAKTITNLQKILDEIGWDLKNVIKVRVYLCDMQYYDAMNKVYEKYFEKDYPARVALSVKELPRAALVEIECVAVGDKIK